MSDRSDDTPENRRREDRDRIDRPYWDQRRTESYQDWYRDRQDRPNVVTFFRELGYDVYNSADVDRLRENLRYADQGRKREEMLKTRWMGWVVSVVIAAIGAILTAVGTWFVQRIK